jgi:hypothetical protein
LPYFQDCGKDPAGNPKRYMVLDGPVQTEPVEQRTYVQLLAKKRALEVPSKILLQALLCNRNRNFLPCGTVTVGTVTFCRVEP